MRPHAAVFAVLSAPFGLASGFVVVVLTYVLTQNGLPLGESATLVASYTAPRVVGFLWAPLVDVVGRLERWYLAACAVAALGLVLVGFSSEAPALGPFLLPSVGLGGIALATMAMAGEALLARAAGQREQMAAWFQVGTLGGGALGGGGGLWLAESTRRPDFAAVAVAVAMLLCAVAFSSFRVPVATHMQSRTTFRALVSDVASLSRTRSARIVALAFVLPIATGAAGNLWAGVAPEYHATAGTVALVTGTLGSVVSALGALAGGRLCRRTNCLSAYLYTSLLLSGLTLLMAISRATPVTFVLGTLAYAFLNGIGYAAFTAAVLEVIGSAACATKYNLYAALAYAPITYMTAIEGKAHDLHGTTGMLLTETVAGVVAVAGVAWLLAKSAARAPEHA